MKNAATDLSKIIRAFWHQYDEDGVKRTIKIDECDRARVSKELARHILAKRRSKP